MHLLDYYLDIFGTLNKHFKTWTKLGFEMHAENAGFREELRVHERVAFELFKNPILLVTLRQKF